MLVVGDFVDWFVVVYCGGCYGDELVGCLFWVLVDFC